MSLETIKERADAATPGPWAQSGNAARPHWYVSNPEVLVHGFGMVREPDTVKATVERWTADAAFIAHARQDIPALLRVAEAAARDMENCAGCKADERGYCYRHNETGPTLRDLDALP